MRKIKQKYFFFIYYFASIPENLPHFISEKKKNTDLHFHLNLRCFPLFLFAVNLFASSEL